MNFCCKEYPLKLLFLIYTSAKSGSGKETATEAGSTGIKTQVNFSTLFDSSTEKIEAISTFSNFNNMSALRDLKLNLKKGYDKDLRPVRNNTDAVLVEIDITYQQVLKLNEKEQTLDSLIFYRLYWQDEYLTWDPEAYGGIKNLWLPVNSIWMPDIVCSEETGTRDFNPRIPFVVVRYDGSVRYLEPTSLQTTCEIGISYFPFDTQNCSLTFTSWTFPTSSLDLSSRRSADAMRNDIATYFSTSGEWLLLNIDITKRSQSFVFLTNDLNRIPENLTNEDQKTVMRKSFFLDPQLRVADVSSLRVTNFHWSEVAFIVKLRRNPLTYVQSMLFPAFLLTAVSILGFYLPPESGERIGLQITILLTFMVFILNVGDMFPASTGPYLGFYFVFCMALLGLNIVMTVLILHLYHIPCKLLLIVNPITKKGKRNLPVWIKTGLILIGAHKDLVSLTVSNMTAFQKEADQDHAMNDVDFSQTRIKNYQVLEGKNASVFSSTIFNKNANQDTHNTQHALSSKNDTKISPEISRCRKKCENRKFENRNWIENLFLLRKIKETLTEIARNVSLITLFTYNRSSALKETKTETKMEEEWKSIARKVDFRCMVVYVSIMVCFHMVFVLVIVFH